MSKPAKGTGVAIRKRSRVPGVMITQYVEELPPGFTTPDFIRKPIALTIQEGKMAFFKAVVNGYPVPEVSWGRNKGDLSNPTKYVSRYDEMNKEYILEIPNVDSDQADTYKCIVINQFGRAICTAALNVIEVGFKKREPAPKSDPEEFRKMLKKTVVKRRQKQTKEGEIDPRFWEVLLSAAKKDYERICQEYGVTDFRWMLKKLNLKKKEREAEQLKYVEKIHSMKQIEVKTDGTAEFELDMKLKDANSQIFLYKDGEMLDYGDGTDDATKHNMQKFGETYLFSIRDVGPEDAGLYQVDVEEANMFSTSLTLPDVKFNNMLKDSKVVEGQDAMFECALSDPVPQITWCANDISVEHGDKYDIRVSKDKQVHKLTVKKCTKDDKGVYTAIAGLRSSQGTLIVEDDPNAHGKGADELARRLSEEKDRLQREKDEVARRAQAEKDEAARKAQAERDEAARRAAEQDKAARRAQAERDEAVRKAQAERDEAARKAQEAQDEAARRAQAEQDEATRRAQAARDEAARKALEEQNEAAKRAQAVKDEAARKAREEQNEAARRAQAEKDEAARKAREEQDEAAKRAQAKKDEAARKAREEQDEAAKRAQAEKDEAARKAREEQDEAARRAQAEKDEAARKAQEEQDEAAKRAQAKKDEAARKAREEQNEAARRTQAEKDEAARKAREEQDEAARRAQAEKDEAARKAREEQDEAAKRAKAEKDEAARKAREEQDEAAKRAKAEKDEAARKAQKEQDEAARRAQAEKDEAARKAQEEQDEAARRAQAEKDEAARKAKAEQEAAERMAAMAAGKGGGQNGSGESSIGDGNEGDGTGKNRKGGDGNLRDGKGDGYDLDRSGGDGSGDKAKKRVRVGELVPNSIIDHGVHFLNGLSDTAANVGESAELSCKINSEDKTGLWYKGGKKLESKDGLTIVKDGANHKLIINDCQERDAGKYKFEVEGRKSEATLIVQDPPKIDVDTLSKFSEPVIVKAGENASFKLPFSGKEPIKIQWFKEDEELLQGHGVKIEKSSAHTRLLLAKCQRKDTGEIKIKIKNEFATVEATSKLIILDRPTPPQGPVEIVESSLSAIEFKWRPPKDDGGCPLTNYNLERQQLGRNTWTKIGDIPGQPTYRDTNIDCGRKYCYRIRAKNSEGFSDVMTTTDIAAGTLAFPGSPAPPKIVSAFKDCINLTWVPPSITGGGSIIGYNLEKRKKGSNFWSQANPKDDPIRDKKYAVKDVIEGAEYEFRVCAINTCGPGELSGPSECAIARDPKKPPGKVKDLKITGSSYTSLSLSWTKPTEVKGEEDEAKGYFVEIRPADQHEWSRYNTNTVIQTSFTVVGLKSMAMYWVRVIATNEGGEGLPQSFDNYIIAMPPPVKPKFTDKKMKSFMVVKAGNTVRVSVSFEASPLPDITWLKDGVPVAKHVTITNFEKGSQLFIYTSELSDTGIYTVNVKNMVGQDTFSIEIRVTDDPKPPGPVELEQNVHGTVTLSWTPSPDEKRDNHLHYMVMKRDSVKQTWRTVVDRLFNNKFTVINILPGREYKFRVFAKNDIGLSEPSVSPVWGTTKQREKFTYTMPVSRTLDFQAPPKFIVSLKLHTAPPGYECYMSCAATGNPTPHITWYHNNVSLNTNPNYYITNVCGVCSLLILKVGPKDMGEYTVVAESPLGHDECSTKLIVK
ncbi:LOW QUALITY PROTEIN: immunoglobulin-like and fibronectin type III domain-containing protein 1 [Ctenopharyngodon idella]|uniref:LOW QUALITY PROTEIN: immunoglobulin-like and fibronectin type III domain-containing protein 1 n=1 Tax=Ctenopharyngodon idella TaxID=7959 RepID=UPI002230FE4A|nr:LOW QUALITY PROTEIN: immunoglobulin-like and fibronectin type III domain-containing protein 1 [Ctenopharyngodon idella]